ncbi:MAG: hypothetical protein ACE5JJ_01305, partial [Nitrospinota bacterium]
GHRESPRRKQQHRKNDLLEHGFSSSSKAIHLALEPRRMRARFALHASPAGITDISQVLLARAYSERPACQGDRASGTQKIYVS